jgi:ABC-type multidrug transport system fused ATPase/permease subunit
VTSEVWVGAGIRRRVHGDRARWRVMYGYVRPHRLALLAGGVLSLFTAATGLALPLVVRALIGDLSHHRAVAAVLLLMTALVIANAALGAVGSYVLRRTDAPMSRQGFV